MSNKIYFEVMEGYDTDSFSPFVYNDELSREEVMDAFVKGIQNGIMVGVSGGLRLDGYLGSCNDTNENRKLLSNADLDDGEVESFITSLEGGNIIRVESYDENFEFVNIVMFVLKDANGDKYCVYYVPVYGENKVDEYCASEDYSNLLDEFKKKCYEVIYESKCTLQDWIDMLDFDCMQENTYHEVDKEFIEVFLDE